MPVNTIAGTLKGPKHMHSAQVPHQDRDAETVPIERRHENVSRFGLPRGRQRPQGRCGCPARLASAEGARAGRARDRAIPCRATASPQRAEGLAVASPGPESAVVAGGSDKLGGHTVVQTSRAVVWQSPQ